MPRKCLVKAEKRVRVTDETFSKWRLQRDSLGFTYDDEYAQYLLRVGESLQKINMLDKKEGSTSADADLELRTVEESHDVNRPAELATDDMVQSGDEAKSDNGDSGPPGVSQTSIKAFKRTLAPPKEAQNNDSDYSARKLDLGWCTAEYDRQQVLSGITDQKRFIAHLLNSHNQWCSTCRTSSATLTASTLAQDKSDFAASNPELKIPTSWESKKWFEDLNAHSNMSITSFLLHLLLIYSHWHSIPLPGDIKELCEHVGPGSVGEIIAYHGMKAKRKYTKKPSVARWKFSEAQKPSKTSRKMEKLDKKRPETSVSSVFLQTQQSSKEGEEGHQLEKLGTDVSEQQTLDAQLMGKGAKVQGESQMVVTKPGGPLFKDVITELVDTVAQGNYPSEASLLSYDNDLVGQLGPVTFPGDCTDLVGSSMFPVPEVEGLLAPLPGQYRRKGQQSWAFDGTQFVSPPGPTYRLRGESGTADCLQGELVSSGATTGHADQYAVQPRSVALPNPPRGSAPLNRHEKGLSVSAKESLMGIHNVKLEDSSDDSWNSDWDEPQEAKAKDSDEDWVPDDKADRSDAGNSDGETDGLGAGMEDSRIKRQKSSAQREPYFWRKKNKLCKICNVFNTANHAKSHRKAVFCEYCDFANDVEIRQNMAECQRIMREHRNENHFLQCRKYLCEECGKGFTVAYGLHHHCVVVHNQNLPKSKCRHCDEMFHQGYSMEKHVEKMHPKSIPCTFPGCDKIFPSKKSHRTHVASYHVKKKKWACTHDGCNKKFMTNFRMLRHVDETHKHLRKFECEFAGCEKMFKSKYSMQVHARIHSDEKPLKCPHCDYSARQRNAMNWHLRKHGMLGSAEAGTKKE